ncbi:uncharacterized protein RHO25_006204 [Cercospora beticola]|uniref:triose-phosphate isomerase n=1 Tax=Cercospora beticola TaxID=122368 RepID=A0ABZ0NQ29_CERBT|nr:hypothetical protein RHO25_006204 [Cercospora beticola]
MPPIPGKREKRIVGTSLKMYFDLPSTLNYIDKVAALSSVAEKAEIDLFVIPDFVTLLSAKEKLAESSVLLGAQDSYSEDKGAFTGEVSPLTLSQAGVKIVEIGHAERRRLFGETDEDVAKKAAAIVRNGMIPLVCIGEKSKGQIASQAVGLAVSECKPQIQAALSQVPDDAEVILAYEPVWAIGAAEPAGADHVVAVTQSLRALVQDRKGRTRIFAHGTTTIFAAPTILAAKQPTAHSHDIDTAAIETADASDNFSTIKISTPSKSRLHDITTPKSTERDPRTRRRQAARDGQRAGRAGREQGSDLGGRESRQMGKRAAAAKFDLLAVCVVSDFGAPPSGAYDVRWHERVGHYSSDHAPRTCHLVQHNNIFDTRRSGTDDDDSVSDFGAPPSGAYDVRWHERVGHYSSDHAPSRRQSSLLRLLRNSAQLATSARHLRVLTM